MAGKRHGVDGDAQLLRLPDGARDAAQVFIAVGNQHQARHHAGGQRADAVANGRFEIGGMAAGAGSVAQVPAVLGMFLGERPGGWRGRTESRASRCRRAAVHLIGQGGFRLQILRGNAGGSVGEHGHRNLAFERRSCAARPARAAMATKAPALSSRAGAALRSCAIPRPPRPAAAERAAASTGGRKFIGAPLPAWPGRAAIFRNVNRRARAGAGPPVEQPFGQQPGAAQQCQPRPEIAACDRAQE